jgi:Ca2+/Na+ antiporter
MDNNLQTFADNTKKSCLGTFISIFVIVLFIYTPLSNYFKTSLFMKSIAFLILLYSIYLNIQQINLLKNSTTDSPEINYQVNMNIYCNYVYTLFLCILLFFLAKNLLFAY